MVTLDEESKDDLGFPPAESLREERRRTGRYVFTVIVFFLSLFSLNRAMDRGVPQYAAFILSALIMLIYILWVLYSSKCRGDRGAAAAEDSEKENEALEEVKIETEDVAPETNLPARQTSFQRSKQPLGRTYSVG